MSTLGDMHHAAVAREEIAREMGQTLSQVTAAAVGERLRFYWAGTVRQPEREDEEQRAKTALLAADEHGLIVDSGVG